MTSSSNSGNGVNSVSTSINNGVSGFSLTLSAGQSATVTVQAPQAVAGLLFGAVSCNVWNPGSNSPTSVPANPNGTFTIGGSTAGTYMVQVFQQVTVSSTPAPALLFSTFVNPSVSPTTPNAMSYTITASTLAILTGGGSNANVMTVDVQINTSTR